MRFFSFCLVLVNAALVYSQAKQTSTISQDAISLNHIFGNIKSICNDISTSLPVCLELRFDETDNMWKESKCYLANSQAAPASNDKIDFILEQFTVTQKHHSLMVVCSSPSVTKNSNIGLIAPFLNEKFQDEKIMHITTDISAEGSYTLFSEDASKELVSPSFRDTSNVIFDKGVPADFKKIHGQNSAQIVRDAKEKESISRIVGPSPIIDQLIFDYLTRYGYNPEPVGFNLIKMKCPKFRKFLTVSKPSVPKYLARLSLKTPYTPGGLPIVPYNQGANPADSKAPTGQTGLLQLIAGGKVAHLQHGFKVSCEANKITNSL